MSLKVLLKDNGQRSIALVTASHALVFRYGSSSASHRTTSKSAPARCIVEFVEVHEVDLNEYQSLHLQGAHGTLGLININTDVFLCVITAAALVATLRPGETVQRITSVKFYCLNKSDYDRTGFEGMHHYSNDASSMPSEFESGLDHEGAMEHPCLALQKLLSSGTFYYSADFDLTNRLQSRSSHESTFDIDSLDEGFLWNSYMINPLIQFRSHLAVSDRELLDQSRILTSAIRGYVGSMIIPASSSPLKETIGTNFPSNMTLISRLSCRRAGTRFNSRGIDDDGNVANFVETETVYYFPSGLCFSYAQVRGSVPIFWEQSSGLLPQQQKIQITRSPEATQPAFNKHFEDLELKYGTVHVLNLLSESKPGEVELTDRYNYHISASPLNYKLENGKASDHSLLQQTQYDFHALTKGPAGYEAASSVRRYVRDYAESFVYYLSSVMNGEGSRHDRTKFTKQPIVILQQEGVFRTNCLDCLDRTNLIQTILSQMALEAFLRHRGEYALSDFWMRHSTLWADNGDALAKIYAGTGALKSSFTRHGKMSLAGAIADVRKSATRLYINNFADKARQNTIDILLGRLVDQSPVQLYDPINDFVTAELNKRLSNYSFTKTINIWVGTFNLNGRGKGTKEELSKWLCPEFNQAQHSPEIVVVGFQEIVELSPQQIMSTDPARRQEWEIAVARTLNEDAHKRGSEEYILLRSGQLVGAALIIYVKASVLSSIKNVEGSVKKTGLSGMAGNKGAVAIRMDFANTGICFITAHLAAGFANYDERNRDYRTISHGIRFQRNRSVEDHDSIVWLGDFNYRVGLDNEKVRRLIDAGDLGTLYQNDQLHLQMVAGNTFPFYSEARITFLPTYKYNNGTDEYDTSEKARIPAWCDRVLWKGDNLRQIQYNTAPLRFSDHRPVYATFECTVNVIDEAVKDKLTRELYNKRRYEAGSGTMVSSPKETPVHVHDDDNDLLEYDSIAPGLPAASSDRRKWWLDNGLPAQSTIADSHKGYIPNPQRPSNPFLPSSEPDWVIVRKTSDEKPVVSNVSNETRADSKEEAQLTRTDSIASTASSSTTIVSRKSAPPVPRKPPLLASKPQDPSLGDVKTTAPLTVISPRTGPVSFPATENRPLSSYQIPDVQSIASSGQTLPALPVRLQSRPTAAMGLMDEEGDRASNIPSLQPRRV